MIELLSHLFYKHNVLLSILRSMVFVMTTDLNTSEHAFIVQLVFNDVLH